MVKISRVPTWATQGQKSLPGRSHGVQDGRILIYYVYEVHFRILQGIFILNIACTGHYYRVRKEINTNSANTVV